MSITILPAVEPTEMQRFIVAKSNQFILHSRYDLSLMEQRILACMISMVDSRGSDLQDCELDIDTFCTLCKIEKRGSARYLKEVTKGLRDQSFWMETEEGVYETFSWVEKISINEKKGKITLRFSNDMKPFLLNFSVPVLKMPITAPPRALPSSIPIEFFCKARTTSAPV